MGLESLKEQMGLTKCADGIPANPTVDQQLRLRKVEHERQLQTINEAITALEQNPEMLRVFNLLIAAGVHRF
jgi:hypothetical protein